VVPELLQSIPRERFPADVDVQPGMSFQARGPRGPVSLTVTSVEGGQVNVDLNHPLAGKRLIFDVTVQEVREPLPHEVPSVSSGCACGPAEQSACGCGPEGSGGCGSGSGGGCGCG
jgi:FKBP-type peptidyl-prolyl cis-trans isomerase SlyD